MTDDLRRLVASGSDPNIADFRRIARVLELADGFMLVPVEVPGPDMARRLASWLQAEGHPVEVVAPDGEERWRELAAALLATRPEAEGAVMLIGRREEAPGMQAGLRLVNQRRDSVGRHLGRPLLWCGPKEFLDLTWRAAPDLWSIADVPRRIEAVVQPAVDLPRLESTRAPQAETTPETLENYEAAREQGDWRNAARIGVALGREHLASDDLGQAESVALEVLGLIPAGEAPELEAPVQELLGRIRFAQGRLEEAEASYQSAAALYEAVGSSFGRARVTDGQALISERRGQLEASLEGYRAALAEFERIGALYEQAILLTSIGRVLGTMRRIAEAETVFAEAQQIQERLGDLSGLAATLTNRGNLLTVAGRHEEARGQLQRALTICQKLGDRRGEALSLWLLGTVDAQTGRIDDARAHLEQALRFWEALGNVTGAMLTAYNLGRLEARAGAWDAAEAWLVLAAKLAAQLGDAKFDALIEQLQTEVAGEAARARGRT